MNRFESNIQNIYGEQGKAWLWHLPELDKDWDLPTYFTL